MGIFVFLEFYKVYINSQKSKLPMTKDSIEYRALHLCATKNPCFSVSSGKSFRKLCASLSL